jgi:hypothetical protein
MDAGRGPSPPLTIAGNAPQPFYGEALQTRPLTLSPPSGLAQDASSPDVFGAVTGTLPNTLDARLSPLSQPSVPVHDNWQRRLRLEPSLLFRRRRSRRRRASQPRPLVKRSRWARLGWSRPPFQHRACFRFTDIGAAQQVGQLSPAPLSGSAFGSLSSPLFGTADQIGQFGPAPPQIDTVASSFAAPVFGASEQTRPIGESAWGTASGDIMTPDARLDSAFGPAPPSLSFPQAAKGDFGGLSPVGSLVSAAGVPSTAPAPPPFSAPGSAWLAPSFPTIQPSAAPSPPWSPSMTLTPANSDGNRSTSDSTPAPLTNPMDQYGMPVPDGYHVPTHRGFGAPLGAGDLVRVGIGLLMGGPVGAVAAPVAARAIGSARNWLGTQGYTPDAVQRGLLGGADNGIGNDTGDNGSGNFPGGGAHGWDNAMGGGVWIGGGGYNPFGNQNHGDHNPWN